MSRKYTRKDKTNNNQEIKESIKNTQRKYSESLGIKSVILNEKQKEFYDIISNNTITFCKSLAGCGKSLTALYYAVQNYLLNPSDEIIVIRTPVENNSDKIGFLPDTLEAKLEPHFASAKALLETLLTKGKVECDLGKRIHFKVPNYMLGSTIDNSVVIIDEAQALQPLILKILLERIGMNTKVIVLGDPTQLYVNDRNRNALSDAINRFCKTDHEGNIIPKFDSIGYFEFDINDVVRSDIVIKLIQNHTRSSMKFCEHFKDIFMKTNLYSLVLDTWYQERFNNYAEVKRTSEFKKVWDNPFEFLRDYRSLSINLGRQQGASTAIARFIKEHPELNIKIIFANEILSRDFVNNHHIDINKHKLFRGMDVEKIDIIFVDDSSYRYMFTTKDKEDFYYSIISQLNTRSNTNQWLIKFQ